MLFSHRQTPRGRLATRPRGFVPQLMVLEDRSLPSVSHVALPDIVPSANHAVAAISPAKGHDHAMPFKESLTITAVSDGVSTYEGHATRLGRVTAFSFPDGSFIKIAANGDQIFGQLYPASATTGSMTFTGGTGEFAHASGSASYVISVDRHTGATNVAVVGTLSSDKQDKGGRGDHKARPFAITGGGPAPQGLPLAPHVLAPHSATGVASFLGSYTGSGTFEQEALAISPTGDVTLNFQGTFTFVAANGDKLVTHYGTGFTGKLTGHLSADGTAVVGVQFDAIFTVDGAQSTGRFAGASGSWRMIAHADSVSLVSTVPGFTAPFDYTWTGGGTIVFAHGKG
jgi:hypothetical protein